MMNNKSTYKEIVSGKVSETRGLVISECSKGGYTVAQQLIVKDNESEVSVFLKGAFHVNDRKALEAFRDVLNKALDKIPSE